MNVRDGAGPTFPVLRTLARGERVDVGPADARGWAPVYDATGERAGYIFRRHGALLPLGPSLPADSDTVPKRRRRRHRDDTPPANATAVCRDGTYSYSLHHRGTCSRHGGVARWL